MRAGGVTFALFAFGCIHGGGTLRDSASVDSEDTHSSEVDADVDADSDVDADADADADTDADADADTDDTGDPPPCLEREPRVEIGGGEMVFESVAEGDGVMMVHGPQGGWHMLGSVRVHNMEPIIEVHFTIHDEETGTVVSDNLYRVAVVQDGDCTGYYPGMYGYMDVSGLATETATRPPEILSHKPVVMTMEVNDFDGRHKTETLRVIAEPDPVDVDEETDSGSR